VNRFNQIYIERVGRFGKISLTFKTMLIYGRSSIALSPGLDDELTSRPMVDARLPDGSRVNAIIHRLH